MQLKTITSAKDTGIDGIEFVKTDKTISEVIIGSLRIRPGSYQGLTILIEQPFESAKRYRMTAKIDGFDPKISFHENKHSADMEATALSEKGAEAVVEHIDVLLGEDGSVVGSPGEPGIERTSSDVPF